MGILLLKSSCTDSFALESSTKAAVWEVPRPYVKEFHLLVLGHLPRCRNLLGLSVEMESLPEPVLHSPLHY